ncbi:MAG: hypothetical protein AAF485_19345, partial [Chloroflexota bacterium]
VNIEKALATVQPIIRAFTKALYAAKPKFSQGPEQEENGNTALIPWCDKQESLQVCSQKLNAFVVSNTYNNVPLLPFVDTRPLKQDITKNHVELAATLFLDILEGWQESGGRRPGFSTPVRTQGSGGSTIPLRGGPR